MRLFRSKNSLMCALLLAGGVSLSQNSYSADCEYTVTNEWHGGFQAAIRITNTDAIAINNWSVSWEYSDSSAYTSGWNAMVSGDNPYTATPLSWNTTIAPGDAIEFGIQGSKGNPSEPALIPIIQGDICNTVTSSSESFSSMVSSSSSSLASSATASTSSVISTSSTAASSRAASSSVSSSELFSSSAISSSSSENMSSANNSLASSSSMPLSSIAPNSSSGVSSSSATPFSSSATNSSMNSSSSTAPSSVSSSIASVSSAVASSSETAPSSSAVSSALISSSSIPVSSSSLASSSSVISTSSAATSSSQAPVAVTCEIGSESIWNSGLVLNSIAVTNTGDVEVTAWTAEVLFDRDVSVSNSWNAPLTEGPQKVIASGNTIAPGSSVDFGFQGAYAGSGTIQIHGCEVIAVTVGQQSSTPDNSSVSISSSPTTSSPISSTATQSSAPVLSSSSASFSSAVNSSSVSSSSSSPSVGLDERPVPTNCVAGEAPSSGNLALNAVWPNVNFTQPIGMTQMPGSENNDYYVMQKGGQILRLSADFSSDAAELFLDMSGQVEAGGEGGIWSMVFHPDYPTSPYIYVSHMVDNNGFETRISRFTTNGITATDEKVLFSLPQNLSPFGSGSIHNAGSMAFGQDGYLYMTLGDDKRNNEIGNPDQLYGTVIRLDINGTGAGINNDGYGIPASNAFDNEVYAYGFRNPWRFSFDKLTGELWLADVGEECLEEVNLVQPGLNYGWPFWEGDQCGPTNGCTGDNTLPETIYHQGNGCGLGSSITGGYVYRGNNIPGLQGKYVYGDFQSGLVWAYDPSTQNNEDLFVDGRAMGLAAFGEDNTGELFYIDLVNSSIQRIENAGGPVVQGPPENLIDTGCFSEVSATLAPANGVMPYTIAQSFWSDGAEKERFLAIPEGTTFDINNSGDWELPVGGVLIKNFKWLGENFETRFFVRYNDGSYGGYTYQWTSENTAVLVATEGKDVQLSDGTDWHYPGRNECLQCHTERAGFILGPETQQMNVDQFYPSTGRTHNQFETLDVLGMLSGNLEALTPFPALNDTSADLDVRANTYLHINCSSCHRGVGGGQSAWDARFTTPFENKGICQVAPVTTVTGAPIEYYINPGDHSASTIWWRMHERGNGQMPPLGSTIVDTTGADLLASWIDAMTPGACPEPTETPCNTPGNLIQNCDFSSGEAPWEVRLGPAGDGSAAVVDDSYEITISDAGSDTWHIQGVQVIGAIDEQSYQIKFDAKAASPRTMEVNIGEQGDDWSSLCQENIHLTTELTSYTIACGVLADTDGDNNVKIDFNIGNDGMATVTLDNVYFGE